ncbi:MAG: NAD(P)H-hydrate dehydratase [Bacteroidales bacterium]|nr:NAD(P)H-hydrate dehydratase [Bacteroidales bacterium]
MKILPVEKIREADAFTIENEPIESIDLMERAASALYEWFVKRCKTKEVSVKIFCGIGNNGGDGLALARMLYSTNIMPQVFVVRYSDKMSADCEINFERLKEETEVPMYDIFSEDDFPQIYDNDIVIDAIFGSGLNRSIEGFTAELIDYLNKTNAIKIAIDVPSGLILETQKLRNSETQKSQQTTLPEPVEGKCQRFDKLSDRQVQSPILKADYTLTFQFPKLAFMFPEYDAFVGKWEVLDIKLHKDFIDNVETMNFYATDDVVRPILRKRAKFSHKGTYGHALLVAGSSGKTGAALLSAEACMRTGVGLLTVHLPKDALLPMQTYLPEAMTSIDESNTHCSEIKDVIYTAVGVGPGLGKHEETVTLLKKIIQESTQPLVLDADALNIIADNPTWLSFLPDNTILTPHPKEFERLFGRTNNSYERLELQRKMSVVHNIIIVRKGAHTAITFPNGICFFNSTGNPGMATAGSGDVLTGMILSLLAQRYSPAEAALLAVFMHGKAGDIAAENIGMESMIARDIIRFINKSYEYLKS